MDTTAQGYLAFTLLIGALLAIPITWMLLRRYYRRIIALMQQQKGEAPARETPTPGSGTKMPFTLSILDGKKKRKGSAPWQERNRTVRWIYLVAIFMFSVAHALVYLTASDIELLPGRMTIMALIYFWPFFLVWPFISGMSRKQWLAGAALYVVVYLGLGLYFQEEPDPGQLIGLFFIINVLPSVLVFLFLSPRLRAAGVVVLVLVTLAVAGAYGIPSMLLDGPGLESVVNFFFQMGFDSAEQILLSLSVLGTVLGILLSWLMLVQLRGMYKHKFISDKTIIIDGVLLYYSIGLGLVVASAGIQWFVFTMLVFFVYKIPAVLLQRLFVLNKTRGLAPKRLLLLRVFALQQRSDVFFRKLSRLWRLQGPVQMIAGPDLIHSVIEPHEFMDFLTGSLSRQYLPSASAVAEKIHHLDEVPAADGNYAVNDFYCFDNTWKQALEGLAKVSDYVVMDLRSFSKARQGCIFEINALFRMVAIEKVLFIVDKTTEKPFLEQTIESACSSLPADSPNCRPGQSLPVRLYLLEGGDYDIGAFLMVV
jgi:hypothetical protein